MQVDEVRKRPKSVGISGRTRSTSVAYGPTSAQIGQPRPLSAKFGSISNASARHPLNLCSASNTTIHLERQKSGPPCRAEQELLRKVAWPTSRSPTGVRDCGANSLVREAWIMEGTVTSLGVPQILGDSCRPLLALARPTEKARSFCKSVLRLGFVGVMVGALCALVINPGVTHMRGWSTPSRSRAKHT